MLLALGAMAWAYAPLNAATIYFSDNFGSGLSQWYPVHAVGSAVLVPQAGHGQVLTFDNPTFGGDIWSHACVPAGSYLSFDYMGFGGFIAVDGVWLAGQSGYPGLEQALIYDGTWRHYEVPVPRCGSIDAEIYSGTSGSARSAFFDNVVVADQPGVVVEDPPGDPPGDPPAVPEGGVGLLGILALLGLCGVNHRLRH